MQITPQAAGTRLYCMCHEVSTILPQSLQSPLLPPEHMHTHIQYRDFSRLRQLLAEREKMYTQRDSEESEEEEPFILNIKCSSKRKAVVDEEDEEDLKPAKKMKKDGDSDYALVSY